MTFSSSQAHPTEEGQQIPDNQLDRKKGQSQFKEIPKMHPLLPIELLNFSVTILKQLFNKNLELQNKELTGNLFGLISLFCYQPLAQRSLRVHKY